jgi:predicted metal-dependent hydrolase
LLHKNVEKHGKHQQEDMNDSVLQSMSQFVRSAFSMDSKYPTVSVKSSVDNRTYKVRDLPDKEEAANLLARLRMRLEAMMAHLVSAYPNKPQVQRLQANFKADPNRFLESTPDAEHTSYSVNKGESVHFCLRQRGSEKLVNENIMMFVALHEMSHMLTQSVGHTPEFWNNFGWLLREAESKKLYTPEDFKAHPALYCGVNITDAPKYDPTKDEEQDGTNFTIGKMS